MKEEDRRELIARQHRALYGNEAGSFFEGGNFAGDNQTPRPGTQGTGATPSSAAGRGSSPLVTASAEGMGQFSNNEHGQPMMNGPNGPSPKPQQQRSRANSTSSPASNNQSFSLFDNAQQSSRTSTSSPGGSPPRQGKASNAPIGSGVAPIGTRPAQNQATNQSLNKRSTTPQLPSPLSYGFASNENGPANGNSNHNNINERSTSAASNPQAGAKENNNMSMNWGSNSGVWGKNPLGVQASVWG